MTPFKKLLMILTACTIPSLAGALDAPKATLHPLSQSGRISLTPAFTPDGKSAFFPLWPCGVIGDCPQIMHVFHFKKRHMVTAHKSEAVAERL